jgi:hypothetical protein
VRGSKGAAGRAAASGVLLGPLTGAHPSKIPHPRQPTLEEPELQRSATVLVRSHLQRGPPGVPPRISRLASTRVPSMGVSSAPSNRGAAPLKPAAFCCERRHGVTPFPSSLHAGQRLPIPLQFHSHPNSRRRSKPNPNRTPRILISPQPPPQAPPSIPEEAAPAGAAPAAAPAGEAWPQPPCALDK